MPDNAKSYYTPLPRRGLIRVGGPGRADFLQGLLTADITALPAAGILYGCLLNAQGKFLHDMFLHHGADDILIDCEGGDRAADLHRRLTLYRLRAPVTLDLTPDHPVYAVTAGGVPDPRHPVMGNRAFTIPDGAIERPFAAWDETRIRHAIPDGSRDIAVERDTVTDANIDRLHGVSFTKGCYVGQEVTARMNYRGLAKKRLYPVQFLSGPVPAPFTDIHIDGALVGQMRGACGMIGLMQLRDDRLPLPDNAPFTLRLTDTPAAC